MEVGIDIEDNERFKNLSKTMLDRTFSKKELERAFKYVNYHEKLCAMWCAKEATVKAFSNLNLKFKDIEVCNDSFGKPFIYLNDTIKAELKRLGCKEIKISISHSKKSSAAICIIN